MLLRAHTGSVKRRDRDEEVYGSIPGTDERKDEAIQNAAEEGAKAGTHMRLGLRQ
jgi:hypothetical protein